MYIYIYITIIIAHKILFRARPNGCRWPFHPSGRRESGGPPAFICIQCLIHVRARTKVVLVKVVSWIIYVHIRICVYIYIYIYIYTHTHICVMIFMVCVYKQYIIQEATFTRTTFVLRQHVIYLLIASTVSSCSLVAFLLFGPSWLFCLSVVLVSLLWVLVPLLVLVGSVLFAWVSLSMSNNDIVMFIIIIIDIVYVDSYYYEHYNHYYNYC